MMLPMHVIFHDNQNLYHKYIHLNIYNFYQLFNLFFVSLSSFTSFNGEAKVNQIHLSPYHHPLFPQKFYSIHLSVIQLLQCLFPIFFG